MKVLNILIFPYWNYDLLKHVPDEIFLSDGVARKGEKEMKTSRNIFLNHFQACDIACV